MNTWAVALKNVTVKPSTNDGSATCPTCGKKFEPYRKQNTFCSRACNLKDKSARQWARRKEEGGICPWCKKATGNRSRRFCGDYCRINYHNAKKMGKVE